MYLWTRSSSWNVPMLVPYFMRGKYVFNKMKLLLTTFFILDFFLWGHLKSVIYTHQSQKLVALLETVTENFTCLSKRYFWKCAPLVLLFHCFTNNQQYFEHRLNWNWIVYQKFIYLKNIYFQIHILFLI